MLFDNAISWRRKEKIKILVEIAKNDLEKHSDHEGTFQNLDREMITRWNLKTVVRRDYLRNAKEMLNGKYSIDPYFQNSKNVLAEVSLS